MDFFNVRMLASTSAAVIATFSLAGGAYAQGGGAVTASEAMDCANLPTQQERDACLVGQAQDDNGVEESGELATIPPEEAAERQAETQAIVVTGSRLRRNPYNSPDPISVIDPQLATQEGKVDTAEVLYSSPLAAGSAQVTSVLSTSFVFDGGEGVQTISLRGLGANRTLVLLNGRRAGPAGTRGAVGAFDLNVIPSTAIQSVDILKTGASSIYGSDAIAGVVNLLTRKDLNGFDVRGFVSLPEESGGETYNLGGMWGKKFSNGHFSIGLDYFRRNELEYRDRSFFDCPQELVFDETGTIRRDLTDPRTGETVCRGLWGPNIGVTNYSTFFGVASNLRYGTPLTTATYIQYDYDGNYAQYIPGLRTPTNPSQFGGPSGYFPIGYDAVSSGLSNEYPEQQRSDSIIPDTKRFTIFADGALQLSPNVELIGEFLFNNRKTRADTTRQILFNSFTGSSIATGGTYAGHSLPYLFCEGGAFGDGEACDPLSNGDPLSPFTGAQLLRYRIPWSYQSGSDIDYYRGVIGAKGDIPGILNGLYFDTYIQHSLSQGKYWSDIIFSDAIEAADFRTELCAGTNTSIRGVPCLDINFADPRVLRGDFTAEESAFLFGRDVGNTTYHQWTAEGSIGGDLFELPYGPLSALVGVQWRRDEIEDIPGEATLAANSYGRTSAGITAGFQRSLEGFGEVRIPILRDVPLFYDLSFDAAARVTNSYAERASDGESDTDNGNWTYKLGANWRVTDWLRFRSTYGTSYRAPALFEQFLQDQVAFFNSDDIDPCLNLDIRQAAGTVTDRVYNNCIAAGIPVDFVGTGRGGEVVSGGGVGVLDPETSKAFTASVVLTPQSWFWDGFRASLAVDYIDIEVNGQITQLGTTNIVLGCYNSETFPTDPLCQQFTRQTDPNAPDAYQILEVRDQYLNIDRQRNKSIDVTARASQDFGRFGSLSLLGQMSWQLKDIFTLFEGTTTESNGELGDPKWVGDFNATWNKKPFTITYGLEVVGKTSDRGDWADAAGDDLCLNSGIRGGLVCPPYKSKAKFYHSLSGTVSFMKKFDVTVGVSNLFDTQPPLYSWLTGPVTTLGNFPALGTQYDMLGRRFFMNVRARF